MQTKVINYNELDNILSDKEKTIESVQRFMKPFQIATTLRNFNHLKIKGFKFTDIIMWLCAVQVLGYSIYRGSLSLLNELFYCGEKCVYYRLMSNPNINWRGVLTRIFNRYTAIIEEQGEKTKEKIIQCFILDDTTLAKTGKCIESITKVYDHVTNCYLLDFKLLLLGYWDGYSLRSVDFSMHSELGKNNKGGLTDKQREKQHTKKREKNSFGQKRKKELSADKIATAIQLLTTGFGMNLQVDYVLTDSWFSCIELIKAVRTLSNKGSHFLGMVVCNRHKFTHNGKRHTTSQLWSLYERKNAQYSRKHKCRYLSIPVEFDGVELRLFLVQYKRNTVIKALITTDVKLSFTRMMDIYGIRWSIEVLFKECKQYLNLGKSESVDFDSQIASITIVMIIHTILTLQKRINNYQTMGELFRDTKTQLLELTLWRRIGEFIQDLICFLLELCDIDVDTIMERILADEQYEKKYISMLTALKTESTAECCKYAI